MAELSESGKRELALALMLWKSFKSDGHLDIDIFKQTIELADYIGVRKEYEQLNKEMLFPFEIKLKA